MKQRMVLGWVMLMVVFGLVSCQTHRNNRVCDARKGATEVENNTKEEDDTSRMIISSAEVIDTLVGDWQIYGIRKPNRYKIKYSPYDYEWNNSVFLTLRYRGRVVLKNKEISSRMLSESRATMCCQRLNCCMFRPQRFILTLRTMCLKLVAFSTSSIVFRHRESPNSIMLRATTVPISVMC